MEADGGPLSSAPAFFILLASGFSLYLSQSMGAAAAVSVSFLFTAALLLAGTISAAPGWGRIFLLVMLLSFLFSALSLYRLGEKVTLPDQIECEGRLISSREWGRGRALLIDTAAGRLAAYAGEAPPDGSPLWLRGAVFDFRRAASDGEFDEMSFWRARGAVKRVVLFELKRLGPPFGLPRWRARILELFQRRLGPLGAAYISALTAGERSAFIEEPHKRAGTIHLLAVSGFHVGLLAAFLFFFVRGSAFSLPFVSAAMWIYAAMAGFPVGGVRAALMIQTAFAALAIGRPYSAFNGVSAAATAMLLYNPWYFFDLGWRLSVLSALFITAAAFIAEPKIPEIAVISILLWFVTAPLAAGAFSSVPLAGLLVNALAVPYFSIIFPLVLLLSLPPLLGLPLGWLFAEMSEAMLFFSHRALDFLSSAMPARLGGSTPLFIAAVLIFSAAAAMRCGVGKKRTPPLALFVLFFILYCRSML
ncbi:MAG: ComEC/Rec2 family competence protein [Synergistaceae bacterium]|nr:ComEC/Rec2 family competence protein [Synergistaceae bacterium]